MAREATKVLPVKPDTKQLVNEQKPDGWTYDYWVKRQLGVADE